MAGALFRSEWASRKRVEGCAPVARTAFWGTGVFHCRVGSAMRSGRKAVRDAGGVALVLIAIAVAACTRGAAAQRQLESASEALSCARAALGSHERLAAVSSLAVTLQITPDPKNPKGRPTTTELTLAFPDGFKKVDRLVLPNRSDLVLTEGFSGNRQFVSGDKQTQIQDPNDGKLRVLRSEFARWALVLLLRDTIVKPLTWSPNLTFEGMHVGMSATGQDGFNMTLLLDKTTCRPLAATWSRATNVGDAMAGRAPVDGRHIERLDLLDYVVFDGIRLPTRMRSTTDGVPRSEWKILTAQVDPPLPSDRANIPDRGDRRPGR